MSKCVFSACLLTALKLVRLVAIKRVDMDYISCMLYCDDMLRFRIWLNTLTSKGIHAWRKSSDAFARMSPLTLNHGNENNRGDQNSCIFPPSHFSLWKRMQVFIQVHVIVVRFNQNWNMLTNFSTIPQYKILWKSICPLWSRFMPTLFRDVNAPETQ
jgi:hypothetical protein